MWKEVGIINSYTMEATFCGSNLGNSQGYHFSTKELELMGYHFCDTLLDYCDPDQAKVDYILNQLTDDYRRAMVDKLQSLGVVIPEGLDPLDIEFGSEILSGIDSRCELIICTVNTVDAAPRVMHAVMPLFTVLSLILIVMTAVIVQNLMGHHCT